MTLTAADIAFEAISQRYLNEMLALTPVTATALGDHRYDGDLDDVSAVGFGRRVALARALIAQLDTLDRAELSRARQVDAQLLTIELEYQIWRIEELAEWRWNPLLYTELTGNSVYLLMARGFAPLPARLRNACVRLNGLPDFLARVREVLDPPRVPRVHAETAVKQNRGLLTLIDQLVAAQLDRLPLHEQARHKTAIASARTAVTDHQLWLEKRLLPEAVGDFRIGAKLYDAKCRFALGSSLSREEIRVRAQSELTRTRAEMYNIARTLLVNRLEKLPLPVDPTQNEQQDAIAAALELAIEQQPLRHQVLACMREAFDTAQTFVRTADFVTVYDDPLEITLMPEFQRGVAIASCDPPGPLDQGQKTIYAISPIPDNWTEAEVSSFLREYNTRSIYNLAIHETMPGHYLQLMHAHRYHSPLRAVLASGTFVEGWAVYAERLMVEHGFLNGDPLMRLIQLKYHLRNIGNAILDQGLHVDGMSREDAMRLMIHDTFQEEREAAAKWLRAQLTAVQLSTYFVGVQEQISLRDEAREVWGNGFTLKRYHDTVLSFGSPPARYVRELMFNLPIE